MNRELIIKTAKTYIDTPYHHQGRIKGLRGGIDCCGLVICVAHELGLSDYDINNYSRTGDGVDFLKEFYQQLEPVIEPVPGDILAFKVRDNSHCGVMSLLNDQITLIHTYALINKCVEHRLDKSWRSKIVASFKFPNIIND